MPRHVSSRTTLVNLKKEARRWLKALRAGDPEARARLARALATPPDAPILRDVQHALAREHGLPGWTALARLAAPDSPLRRYERVAEALVIAYGTGEAAAMQIVWDYFGHMRRWDAMRRYVRLDLGRPEQPHGPADDAITLDEARYLVARAQDFESWQALAAFAASVDPGKAAIVAKSVGAYDADANEPLRTAVRTRDWNELFAALQHQRLTGVHANGQMTDALLERICANDHIRSLNLEASRGVTDEGLRHLAHLPRLRHLNLTACSITDRGLDVLRHLPRLESIRLAWTQITDDGARNLQACEHLSQVDLSGTPSGDGAIRALAGKARLHEFRSGQGVTNDGLAALQALPIFRTWHGGDERIALLSPDARPNFLMLRGPFTDRGLAHLAWLEGLFALSVDDSRLAITGAGLTPLAALPHLAWLAFDAKDDSMPQIAALPHLRFLMCQDTTAGDDGFIALSRSPSIEYIWGRRCYGLQRRGFMALADMPALQYLSVSCRNVDDTGLSALPRFPSLTELMPMDVPDGGYRHVGRCARLESLVLMYCRETSDTATEHIVGLTALKKYFASYNRITDRTPELLAGMPSLEEITFDSCSRLTNAGVASLARLPRLRELRVSSMPKVTAAVADAFPARVRVTYAT